MRDSSPRAPFDQGLFLAHFNKGKDLFEQRRVEEAERELEEAYLLRPRDPNVLNLLGLVYFKQDKLEKAEEVYRKLAAESPAAHTLFYNLGLIYFKLNRLEEAEAALLRSLELSRENPKINFYLGSIYERLKRPQDAIYQYRQAGANIMVRRVEDKLAAAPPSPAATRSPTDDTAEYKLDEVAEAIRQRRDKTLPPSPTIQPFGEALMAEGARRPGASDTAPIPLVKSPQGFPEIASFASESPTHPGSEPETLPPGRSEAFRFLRNNLMEIDFTGKVFIKQGTVYSYSGNLAFWVKEKRPGGLAALVIVTGTGKVILTDKDREITFMRVEGETVFVEPTHLLACEEGLNPRYAPLGEPSRGLDFVVLEGRGMVALSVASKPLPLTVTPELPASVPSSSVITWRGALTPRLVDDRQIHEVMMAREGQGGSLIRLEGTGQLLMEQAV